MNSLLSNVKNAKITTREVLIHLRKNGEIKRASYLKYLKMQYRLAGDAYKMLQSTSNNFENHPKINTPADKKSSMPIHLSKSEMSIMSYSFDDITFLTEAWHFYQKKMMMNLAGKPDVHPISKPTIPSGFVTTNRKKHPEELIWNNNESPIFTNKSSQQTKPQVLKIRPPASSFGTLSQHYRDPLKSTPLCIQILKWAQEGKLNLN